MQVNPGQAIKHIIMLLEGYFQLRSQGEKIKMPSVYLQGEPGVGKTSIAGAVAKHFNYLLVEISANQSNPDDVAGIRMPNVETRTTDWYPPSWMPVGGKIEKDGRIYDGVLLFFDELSAADDRVRKPLFSTFLEYSLNGHNLPGNTIVMGAGNDSETGTMVFDLDNATRSRLITLIIKADLTSWLTDYAALNDFSPTVASVLKNNMGIFCETAAALERHDELYGNPRNWERCSDAERVIMLKPEHRRDEDRRAALKAMVAGRVGLANAETYDAVFETVAQSATLFDILEAKRKGRSIRSLLPQQISQLSALSFSMMAYPTSIESAKEVFAIMDDFPSDHTLPLRDSIPAIQETVLKKLRKAGFKDKDLAVFQKTVAKTAGEFHDGPIISIEI